MNKYEVTIVEVAAYLVEVYAESEGEAIEVGEDLHINGGSTMTGVTEREVAAQEIPNDE